MIYDRLESIVAWEYLPRRMKTARDHLRETDLKGLADGIDDVEGTDVHSHELREGDWGKGGGVGGLSDDPWTGWVVARHKKQVSY
jgi:hypothetical protein